MFHRVQHVYRRKVFHKLRLSMARKVHLHFVKRMVQMVHSLEGATWNEQKYINLFQRVIAAYNNQFTKDQIKRRMTS